MRNTCGIRLAQELHGSLVPFIGVYDVMSASVAGQYYNHLFISGFGFAASYYGLPDIGFIAWSDMVDYVQRIHTVLPEHLLLVDIDDGYCDAEVACHVVSLLDAMGAAGVILEDQQRPRKCGHYEGKRLMELPDYLEKLQKVLDTRHELVVVARTDADERDEMMRRARAFADIGADAVLVDAVPDLDTLRALKDHVQCPVVCNQLAGGKTPNWSITELAGAGASIAIYSTPCLFAAQSAIMNAMQYLQQHDGRLAPREVTGTGLQDCTAILQQNLAQRGKTTDVEPSYAIANQRAA